MKLIARIDLPFRACGSTRVKVVPMFARGRRAQLEACAKLSIMSPVPPRETCATTAVRRCSLVMTPRLIANDRITCWPLRRPRFVVSMNTPVADRFMALQSFLRPPGTLM
jgi:hypothetical protein